jgi:hypothetical protein
MLLSQAFTHTLCPPSCRTPEHREAEQHGGPLHHSRILGSVQKVSIRRI